MVLLNQVILRMCLINPRTTIKDINETIEKCEKFGDMELLKLN